ncbi:MAG: heme-copper oxidase subunit III [Anaerolineae bacterium]|nr:heme-copper oxidase subunit III [Anaerolineae bacterium]
MNTPSSLQNDSHESVHGELSLSEGNRKFGIWLFLSSELLIFMGLIAGLLLVKWGAEKWPHFEGPTFYLVSINTLVLLLSSLTVVLGIDAIKAGDVKKLSIYIAISAFLGVVFLGGQAIEYNNLIVHEGHGFADDPFGAPFFTLTGFHGLHVLVGVIWALAILNRAKAGVFNAKNYTTIEMFGLFWHFVDLVWIVIFTIVYLINFK